MQGNSGYAKKGDSPSQNTSAKKGFGVFSLAASFLLSFSIETEWKEEYFGRGVKGGKDGYAIGTTYL